MCQDCDTNLVVKMKIAKVIIVPNIKMEEVTAIQRGNFHLCSKNCTSGFIMYANSQAIKNG
jgi:hypothetical protein